jgi:mono/diheme cytochrome c family protein
MKVLLLPAFFVLRQLTLNQRTTKPVLFLAMLLLIFSSLLAACDSENGDLSEAAAPADPVINQGQNIFRQNCASCHSLTEGTVIVGPSLADIAGRAGTQVEGQTARDYIQFSILRPGDYIVDGYSDLMPTTFGTTLSGEELDALVAYLMTLE